MTQGCDPGFDSPLPFRDSEPRRPLRIALVGHEFLGAGRGVVGKTLARLVGSLDADGHVVTILDTLPSPGAANGGGGPDPGRAPRVVPLPDCGFDLHGETPHMAISHRVATWLREHDDFDVVHFIEAQGHGYYTALAKRQGTMLRDATVVVGLQGATAWAHSADGQFPQTERDLEEMYLERRSAELADAVWSPSGSMLDWARQAGWDLPSRSLVLPPMARRPVRTLEGASQSPRPVRELVFFGRQAARPGLFLFLDAIDRLAREGGTARLDGMAVTILGEPSTVRGKGSEAVVLERAQRWPFETRILSDLDRDGAVDYLRGAGRLAVLSSIAENDPDALLDCLGAGLPFLASRVGCVPELVHGGDVGRVCVDPNPRAFADRLMRALDEGLAPARPAVDLERGAEAWARWHEGLAAERPAIPEAPAPGDADPTVSVCFTHYNRPQYLRQALDAILAQDRPPLEVIVVDDGSPSEDVQRGLDAIAADYDFEGRGWRLIRQENRFLGAARNRGAFEARGDYLLFNDDDNVAKPHEISTFLAVARRTGADLLTCFHDAFEGADAPDDRTTPRHRSLFTGPNLPVSPLLNTFGDANALVRRSAFLELGGFTEDFGVGQEDWEFFARMALGGYKVDVVPDSLFWYRISPDGLTRWVSVRGKFLRSSRPYLDQIPRAYHPLIEMCLGRSLADHGQIESCHAPAPLGPALPGTWPLRYKIADAINARLKRLSVIHRSGKVLIRGLLRLKTLVKGRSLGPTDPQGMARSAYVRQDSSAQEPTSRRASHASGREGRAAGRR